MKKETILLTGATGFLGSYLLKDFLQNNYNVIILKRSTSNTNRIKDLSKNYKSYNIDELNSLNAVFVDNKIDIIVHTACSYGRNNQSIVDIVKTNLIFGLNLMELGIDYNVKTFINTGSLLPRDVNNYSLSKSQLSDWLKLYSDKIQFINLKVEHMYGPKDDKKKFLPWLINEMINNREKIKLTTGLQKRDFIYIDDVVAAFDVVLEKRKQLSNYSEFDVGTNKFTQVKDFVIQISKALEKQTKRQILPKLKFGAIDYRKGDIMIPDLNNSSLLKLGWRPKVEIEEGIKKILKKY
uniref:NAD-dependent epimerase/dehydratase n=1 Tax=uncultured Polaribacter sp. TaxID=174711 RepID=UPI0026343F2D|nr:NAD-dependent epimerase/dehydratase [uncultured Polaribacter sp.]